MLRFITGLAALLGCVSSFAQLVPFTPIEEDRVLAHITAEVALPLTEYRTLDLDVAALQAVLQATPLEFTDGARSTTPTLSLPLTDGTLRTYRVVESTVMEPELQARWPQLRTYRLFAVDDPSHTGRLTVTPQGCTAVYRTAAGEVYLEPYAWGEGRYHVLYQAGAMWMDAATLPTTSCGYQPTAEELAQATPTTSQPAPPFSLKNGGRPAHIRNYVLALTCTGEYAQLKGGTVESVLASFVTAVNLANATFEREVGVRVILIGLTENLIFLDPVTDPFQNADEGDSLLGQVRNAIVERGNVPADLYDMGHVFTGGCTDVGGVVGGGARVCGGNKEQAVTCHYSNNLAFIVQRVMTHEVGHHFSVSHSWNNCPGNQGQRAGNAAFEPGSGTTIMSYAGSCGAANNLPGSGDGYYHGYSLEQFINFTREFGGSTCAFLTETANTEPELELPYTDGFYIPIATPFELTATATDENGDALTYCWEQLDLGPAAELGAPIGDGPSFRSFPPRAAANRVFPNWNDLLANRSDVAEVLPTYDRELTFRCTVRDNNEEIGATIWEDVAFHATASAGPFRVLAPNTGSANWSVGSYQEVRWDVANTDNELVNCQEVNILLSTDGGRTYPYLLLEGAPNLGSAFVTVPELIGSEMRIRVQAARNIFFDVSNNNFRISPATDPTYTLDMDPLIQQACIPTTVAIDFNSSAILGYEGLVTLSVASELPEGVQATFSAPSMLPGERSRLELNFTSVASIAAERFPLTVQAVAPAQDTFYRTFYLDPVNSDFSALNLIGPDNGMLGVEFEASFSWTEVPDALEYDWRISSDLSFTEVHEIQTGIQSGSVNSTNFFDENTLYYWQVRPRNECGNGDWTVPAVLHTIYTDCELITATGLPTPIPVQGPLPTIRSRVFVDRSGAISDVNLPLVDLRYNPIRAFDVKLTSPAGTQVTLYDGTCFSSDRLWVGFDDDAPDALFCPPNTGVVVQPHQPLTTFIGEDAQGEWTLEVKINERGFSSGSLREWGVEFCADFQPSQPRILVNNPLEVPPGQSNPITRPLLEVTDPDQGADELYFTLVALPAHGNLELAGRILNVGDQFRQNSINLGNVRYRHDGSDTEEDAFFFLVQDGTGGFVPVERFVIQIDDEAVVNTEEPALNSTFELFPNPASTWVTIRLAQVTGQVLPLRIFNAGGQQIWTDQLAPGSTQRQISTRDWPRGVYYLRAGGSVRKLVVE